ncbi:MFS family permease [Mucilaginibacter rubeus]|uniref:MFS transporter n=1 Tax=Mucilaginibacter rubeus TaxID=2027860 RepID=UPI003392665F
MKTTKIAAPPAHKLPVTAIIIAALGYFVDIYDLLLFSIIRVPALSALGLTASQVTEKGIFLLNTQMAGLMLGGICWGILGDKKGRLQVLFGSILIYSLANIANGFAGSVDTFAICRFIAGFGLAGELGAGITLVAEMTPMAKRGYATSIVASIGISGAVAAYFTADIFDWRAAFFIGGGLGVLLLFLRVSISESPLFCSVHSAARPDRGNFFLLFTDTERLKKYLRCIALGVPFWFAVGILISFTPEFGRSLHIIGVVSAGPAVACFYGGSVISDLLGGLMSQYLKSRKKAALLFMLLSAAAVSVFLAVSRVTLQIFYGECFFLGFASGYWALFMTIATEQFGTNIRATVTTTVPNFVRGAVLPLSFLFQVLTDLTGSMRLAGWLEGLICLTLSSWSIYKLKETFHKDLNYCEN